MVRAEQSMQAFDFRRLFPSRLRHPLSWMGIAFVEMWKLLSLDWVACLLASTRCFTCFLHEQSLKSSDSFIKLFSNKKVFFTFRIEQLFFIKNHLDSSQNAIIIDEQLSADKPCPAIQTAKLRALFARRSAMLGLQEQPLFPSKWSLTWPELTVPRSQNLSNSSFIV